MREPGPAMQDSPVYEKYPFWMVLVSTLLSVSVYVIGAVILSWLGLAWLVLYLLFILLLELRLVRGHCVDCWYYGKTCAFAKGQLSAMFFPKGALERFSKKTITWKDIVPDFLVFIIPLLAGIALLIRTFSWILLLLIIALCILGFVGNALVRGHIACKYCKQREIGCPAQRLFDRTKE
ncbi:MAG: hypothetical protein NTY71_05445 [Methanoregula sp.]|nr:hypothetical protein [Methanoregula sp.]